MNDWGLLTIIGVVAFPVALALLVRRRHRRRNRFQSTILGMTAEDYREIEFLRQRQRQRREAAQARQDQP